MQTVRSVAVAADGHPEIAQSVLLSARRSLEDDLDRIDSQLASVARLEPSRIRQLLHIQDAQVTELREAVREQRSEIAGIAEGLFVPSIPASAGHERAIEAGDSIDLVLASSGDWVVAEEVT